MKLASRVQFGCFYNVIEGRQCGYIELGCDAQLAMGDEGVKQLLRAPDADPAVKAITFVGAERRNAGSCLVPD